LRWLPKVTKYGLLNKGGECKMEEKIEQVQEQNQTQPLVHSFTREGLRSAFTPKVVTLLMVVVVVGIISGYLISGKNNSVIGGKTSGGALNTSSISKGTVEGSNDTKTFKDTVQGTLKMGGIDGEGIFHLVRPGGDSQNVYLTSSTVDLSKFINKNIKVWGQTQKAQHAGWLMDVGRVEVL
jgi:hypothetical protein